MNIAVCDDDSLYGSHLVAMCREFPFIETVDFYENPTELLETIDAIHSYDVLLMDIVFETEKNGIDYMAELYKKYPTVHIVYMTAYTDYYVSKVFLQQTNVSGFLQKPINKELLLKTLQMISNKLLEDKNQLILFRGKRPSETLIVKNIQYLESDAHKTFIYTETSSVTELESHMTYERLNLLLMRLPSKFYACHKSYVVNMDKIVRIDRTEVLLSSGTTIPVSKSRCKELKAQYFNYIQTKL